MTPSPDVPEIPLFEPDDSGQIAEEDHLIVEQGSPHPPFAAEDHTTSEQSSPSSPLPLLSLQINAEESHAMEEMRDQFRWLVEVLIQNQRRGWGTAYRDFA